jgi:hypothetical protein
LTSASSGDFTNSGTMVIGSTLNTVADSFTVGGGHNYIQTGGSTLLANVNSTLAAANVNVNGGILAGVGTVQGNLIVAGTGSGFGTILPGLVGSIGALTVTGNFSDPFSGHLNIQLDPTGSSLLDVGGSANLTGMALDITLLNGFLPTHNTVYEIIATQGGVTGMFTDPVIVDGNVTFTAVTIGNDVFLDATVPTNAVPEPASIVMLGIGAAGMGAASLLRRLRQRRSA